MEFLDVMEEESGCSFHCDYCVCQNKVYSFGDRVHDSYDSIMSGGLQEFNHEIDTEHIPLYVWHREAQRAVAAHQLESVAKVLSRGRDRRYLHTG